VKRRQLFAPALRGVRAGGLAACIFIQNANDGIEMRIDVAEPIQARLDDLRGRNQAVPNKPGKLHGTQPPKFGSPRGRLTNLFPISVAGIRFRLWSYHRMSF
jgi:hypothetical protein